MRWNGAMKFTVGMRIAAGTVLSVVALAGCSSATEPTTQPSATVSDEQAPDSPPDDCVANPSMAPPVPVEPYGTVPEQARISVSLSDIGRLTPGGAPVDVAMTLCNDSAVNYPRVGVVLVLGHCSCAANPMSIPVGSVERFDDATAAWVAVEHPTAGMGMDYLGAYSDVQALPRGQRLTVRFRIALDASMTAGEGVVEAAAVTPEPLNRIGTAEQTFVVG